MQISSKQSNSEEVFSSAVHVEKSSNLGILIILKLKGFVLNEISVKTF